jgi:hypothetical protein
LGRFHVETARRQRRQPTGSCRQHRPAIQPHPGVSTWK